MPQTISLQSHQPGRCFRREPYFLVASRFRFCFLTLRVTDDWNRSGFTLTRLVRLGSCGSDSPSWERLSSEKSKVSFTRLVSSSSCSTASFRFLGDMLVLPSLMQMSPANERTSAITYSNTPVA
ncbi:unnamed protein product [Chrysodeixis includens]|uniref:Uncharacterized protein n=1 Tax=Chrysodeixis includens TaxID=689277 RepID=A0A9N8KNY5_CHRIL|nr:unnamed protein product [Chrysodeixis includens]